MGAINNNLTYRLIRWPSGDGAVYVMEGFERRRCMKHILGAIDGSHIAIKAPREDQDAYINRKRFQSIVLQAVCM